MISSLYSLGRGSPIGSPLLAVGISLKMVFSSQAQPSYGGCSSLKPVEDISSSLSGSALAEIVAFFGSLVPSGSGSRETSLTPGTVTALLSLGGPRGGVLNDEGGP